MKHRRWLPGFAQSPMLRLFLIGRFKGTDAVLRSKASVDTGEGRGLKHSGARGCTRRRSSSDGDSYDLGAMKLGWTVGPKSRPNSLVPRQISLTSSSRP